MRKEKKTVTINYGAFDFDCETVASTLQYLEMIEDKTAVLEFTTRWEGDTVCDIKGTREETDEEFERRCLNEENMKAANAKARYKDYLKLKAEFEG